MIHVGAAVAILAPLLPIAQAAVSVTAICTYASWTSYQGQTPCEIWGNLQGKCNPNASVPKLDTSTNEDAQYLAPNGTSATPCQCNVVAYNLMGGCSWCQPFVYTQNWMSESQWKAGCSSYDSSGQLPSVASSLASSIPPWARLQVDGTTWSPSEAEAIAESGSTGTSDPFPTSSSFGGDDDDDPFDDDDFDSNIVNVGMAVGIAVGVIFGVWLIVFGTGLAVFLVRKRNREAWYGPTAEYYRNGGRMYWQETALLSEAKAYPMSSPSVLTGSLQSSTPPLQTPYTDGGAGFAQPVQGYQAQSVAYVPNQYQQSPGQPNQFQQPSTGQYQSGQYDASMLYPPGGAQSGQVSNTGLTT